MAILDTAQRKRLAKKVFGEPGSRKYPVPDAAHARAAKARASEEYNKGKLSASMKAKIDAKANRKLGKK